MKCTCGHEDYEHHTQRNIRTWEPFYGECLHYGFNETGGMRRRFSLRARTRVWVKRLKNG